MSNRLAAESSPYLLQHAENPVAWQPWDDAALAEAKRRDCPILLSIGYAACHWCHVMERESFEDPTTASLLNADFVCIKVDREERPDLDDIYMEALQAMNGHGGWPLTAFCDPDGVPFYCGTYFPPQPRQGMPSFAMVIEAVGQAWHENRGAIAERAPLLVEQLGRVARLAAPPQGDPPAELLARAESNLLASADPVHGGFGGAPKFPPASAIEFLLGRGESTLTRRTLDAIAAGGIHDQLGGGFARYSVDERWLVPHFEKMLYDNALLARALIHDFKAGGPDSSAAVAASTLDWALGEMRGPEGGFASSLDADSEGEEGRFYLFTASEFDSALAAVAITGEQIDALGAWWGISGKGNFEGKNILHLAAGADGLGRPPPARYDDARAALLTHRSTRVRPGCDDKRLCSWNALMVGALAEVGAALGQPPYLDAARSCAEFILTKMRDEEGRLLRTWKDGSAKLNGYLEDHAFLLEALLTLYEASFEARWYEEAVALCEALLTRFHDEENGGFFSTSHDHERLISRRKDHQDHPIPSGNSSAALGLARLAALSGEARYGSAADGVIALFGSSAARNPNAFAHLLQAIQLRSQPSRELALIAPADGAIADLAEMAALLRRAHLPDLVIAGGLAGQSSPPLLEGRGAPNDRPTAYLCEQMSCQAPIQDLDELARALGIPRSAAAFNPR